MVEKKGKESGDEVEQNLSTNITPNILTYVEGSFQGLSTYSNKENKGNVRSCVFVAVRGPVIGGIEWKTRPLHPVVRIFKKKA